MKGAAAALAGALLFFLGVLTAASDGGRVSPTAIPLGVDPVVFPGEPAEGAPAGPPAPDPAIPAEGAPESTEGGPSSSPAAGEEPPAAGGSQGVEEVGGRIDCVEVGGQDAGTPAAGDPDRACPPGQAKKAGDEPKDAKGAGDGQR